MTSGTKAINIDYANYSARTWNGGDGKYQTSFGKRIPKWNNYTMTEYTHSGSKSTKGYLINVGAAGGTTETDLPGWADVQLQSKLTSKIRGHDFNAGVFAAEAKMTTSLVVDTVTNLSRAIRDLKHGDVASAARRLSVKPPRRYGSDSKTHKLTDRDVSGRWLELQYGWLPLLSDVNEAANALRERTQGPRIERIHTSKSVARAYNGSSSPSNYSGLGEYKITKHYWYEMTEKMTNQRSLGLTHPLSVMWEVLPYSFVIDWFIPIGSYLDNLAIIPSLTGRKMTMIVREWTATGVGITPLYQGASANFHKVAVARTVGSIDLATPSFKSLSQAASSKHIANAIALAHQRIR